MDPPTLVNTIPATIEARSGFGVSSGPMRPVPEGNDLMPERSAGAGHSRLSGLDGDRVQHPVRSELGSGEGRLHHAGDHTYPPENPNGHTTLAQQASTAPGDGSEVASNAVPFKERVVGVAQKTRGTLLGKSDLKEHGQAILEGRTTHAEDKTN